MSVGRLLEVARPTIARHRVWGTPRLLLATVAAVALVRAAPGTATDVIGRGVGVRELVWPAAPLVATVPVGVLGSLRAPDREATSPRGSLGVSLRALAVLALLGTLLVLASGTRAPIVARNWSAFTGLGLGTTAISGGAAAWLPGLLMSMTMWLLGTTSFGPRAWAVVFRPTDDPIALRCCLAIAIAGTGVFLVHLVTAPAASDEAASVDRA